MRSGGRACDGVVAFPVHRGRDAWCRVVKAFMVSQVASTPHLSEKDSFVSFVRLSHEACQRLSTTAFEVPLKAVSVLPSPVNGATHFASVSAGTCTQLTCIWSHKAFSRPPDMKQKRLIMLRCRCRSRRMRHSRPLVKYAHGLQRTQRIHAFVRLRIGAKYVLCYVGSSADTTRAPT